MRAHQHPVSWPRLTELAGIHPVTCWDTMKQLLAQNKIERSHVHRDIPYYKLTQKPEQESLFLS